MSKTRHYSCHITKPAKGSRYAFLLTSFAISDAEPSLPLWHGPVEIAQDMPSSVKAYYARFNPTLAFVESGFRMSAIEHLRRAGVPEANLIAPLNSDVEALVAKLIEKERLAGWCREQIEPDDTPRRNGPFDSENVDRELCARVIGTALISQPGCGHEATAKYLNEGLPPGAPGLTRHHVLRAYETLRRYRRQSPRQNGFMSVWADCELLSALNIVYEHARRHAVFRKYRGEELAWAVHEDFDLNERIHRALKMLPPNRFAAV